MDMATVSWSQNQVPPLCQKQMNRFHYCVYVSADTLLRLDTPLLLEKESVVGSI